MSWLAQVRHVVAKDARHMAWLIVLTLVVIGVTTARATELIGAGGSALPGAWFLFARWGAGAPLVAVVAAAFVTLLVQSDSPARSDAFWVTRPLAPSAVLGAKLALSGLLLVLIPLAGQLAVFLSHDVAANRIVPLLAESALSMVGILGLVATFAALTPDLRTFIAAFLLALVAWVFGAGVVRSALIRHGTVWQGSAATLLPSVVFAVGGLAITAYQYRTRNVRRTIRVFALPAVAALALMTLPRGGAPAAVAGPPPAPELRATRLLVTARRVDRSPGAETVQWRADLNLDLADADDRHRYALVGTTVTFRLPDGSTSTRMLESFGPREFLLSRPPLRLPGFRWLPERTPPVRQDGWTASVPVPENVARAILAGQVDLVLDGAVEVDEQRDLGAIPLRPGAWMRRDGRRIRIESVDLGPDGPMISTSSEAIEARSDAVGFSFREVYDVAAIHPGRREALWLNPTSEGMGVGHDLVLPGPVALTYATMLQAPARFPRGGQSVDQAWLGEAQLELADWVPVGSYPIHVEVRGLVVGRR